MLAKLARQIHLEKPDPLISATKHHLLQGNVALYSPPTLEDSSIIENRMIFAGSSDIFLDDTLPTYLCFAPPNTHQESIFSI